MNSARPLSVGRRTSYRKISGRCTDALYALHRHAGALPRLDALLRYDNYLPATMKLRAREVNRGLATIPLGTAAAIAFLPSDASVPGSLMLSAWILTVALLATVVLDVLSGGFERIFMAEHVLLIGMVIVLYTELLQPGYTIDLEKETIQVAFLASGAFATAIAFGSSLRPPRLPKSVMELSRRAYSARLLYRIVIACWFLAMLNFLAGSSFSPSAMIDGLFAGRFSAPWSRGQLGGWDAFRDFLTYFAHLVPVFTVLLALRTGSWTNFRVLTAMACSLTCIAFISQSGGRRLIVVILGSALITWALVKRRELRPKHYLTVAATVLLVIVGLEIMLQVRDNGFGSLFNGEAETKVSGVHVDNNFYSLGQTLRVIPSEVNFVGFRYLFYILVRPVPRAFWENKPVSPGFDLAEHLGFNTVAISITSPGELYASYGWIGLVLGGCFLGWLARAWSQLIERDCGLAGSAFYAIGAMALFLGLRSLIELILMCYPLVCWYTLDRILWVWVKPHPFPRQQVVLR